MHKPDWPDLNFFELLEGLLVRIYELLPAQRVLPQPPRQWPVRCP